MYGSAERGHGLLLKDVAGEEEEGGECEYCGDWGQVLGRFWRRGTDRRMRR